MAPASWQRPTLVTALSLALLTACGEGPEDTPPPAPGAPATAAPTPPKAQATPSAARILAPSPLALQAKVKASGLTRQLGDLAPDRSFVDGGPDKDRTALRTGVVLADTILTGEISDKATFLANLRALHAGMASLGTGQGLLSSIDDFIVAVDNDTAARADFIVELDNVASMMVVEDGWGPGDTTGPLLQAGAWLAGTNLVALAIVDQAAPDAAEALLRQGDVAKWYLDYLKGDGATKIAPATRTPLESTLTDLVGIAERPALGVQDAADVAAATQRLLALL